MTALHVVDITELATLGEQFPPRLMLLGFRLMQVIDEAGKDDFQYIIPPICDVPAGPFLMGSDRQHDIFAQDDELPQAEVRVPAFQIGQYPLTVAEYGCAVAMGMVTEPKPHYDNSVTWQIQRQYPDHPVVCISWLQARDYAAWLTLVTNDSWRLPTEAEWEKAARGIDGRVYPWGDEFDITRANTGEGGPYSTTAIGTYAKQGDASPYGAHDMAGNVWEWTNTIRDDRQFHYPYQSDDGREDMKKIPSMLVLRGGSWNYSSPGARAAYRSNFRPVNFRNDVGVRLVRVLPHTTPGSQE